MEIELGKTDVFGQEDAALTHPLQVDAERAAISRRAFLRYTIGAVSSFVAIVTAVPILGYLGGALQVKGQAQWVKLGQLEHFAGGEPQLVQFTLTRQDGWVEVREERSAWVVPEGNSVAVFNGRCTHLGCAYSWQQEGENAGRFFCPCHGGLYDRTGKVTAGPPPRPLDRLETRIDNGDLLVLYLDFRPGVSERVAL